MWLYKDLPASLSSVQDNSVGSIQHRTVEWVEAFAETALEFNFPFYSVLLPLPSHRCWPQGLSLVNFLHEDFHVSKSVSWRTQPKTKGMWTDSTNIVTLFCFSRDNILEWKLNMLFNQRNWSLLGTISGKLLYLSERVFSSWKSDFTRLKTILLQHLTKSRCSVQGGQKWVKLNH